MTIQPRRSRRRRAALAASLALALVVASCGRDDDSAATTTAAPSSTATPTSAAPTTAAAPGDSTASSAAEDTSTTVAAPAPGDFGSLKEVCGPGDAKGATAQGVTDTEITVGTIADPGNTAVPGLGQELFDSGKAFVEWCNSVGGIKGRKIKLNLHDGKLFDVGPATIESCQTDFMSVGGAFALDSAAVEPRVACGLTQIAAYTASPEAGRAPGSIEALANSDTSTWASHFWLVIKDKDPDVMSKVAFWGPALPSVIPITLREVARLKMEGFDPVDYQDTPTSVDNWRPFVEKLKAVGAQVLIFNNTARSLVPVMKAMADVDYYPKYIVSPSIYEHVLIEEIGAGLDRTMVIPQLKIVPFEMADTHPAVKQMLEMVKATNGDVRTQSSNSMSAWVLFAVAAGECGSNLTRECVMEKAVAHKGWTGGGLHRPSDPGPTSGPPSDCSALLHATPKGFVVATDLYTPNTDEVFQCDPGIAVVVKTS